MKKALIVLIQIVLYFVVFAAFSFLHPLGLHWFVSHPTPTVTRYFVADGLVLATALFVLVLLFQAATKSLRRLGSLTALSFVAAMLAGFAVKLGWFTHDLFN